MNVIKKFTELSFGRKLMWTVGGFLSAVVSYSIETHLESQIAECTHPKNIPVVPTFLYIPTMHTFMAIKKIDERKDRKDV
jgi:hypothetical protein